MKPPPPPRIHVLLARDKPLGVVMRRGPAKYYSTMLWDLRRDEFEMGQWVRALLYPFRSDLSPDGRYLLYFALNGRWQSETRGTYTAISRAPYLKALTLYPKGDTWGGGGLWTGPNTYWLNHSASERNPLRATRELTLDAPPGRGAGFGECGPIYYDRLARDGWIYTGRQPGEVGVFEKPVGRWIIRKLFFYVPRTGYRCRHELVHPKTSAWHDCPDWEWAEVRGKEILYAERGCLYRAQVGHRTGIESHLVRDLNGMKFEPIRAPY